MLEQQSWDSDVTDLCEVVGDLTGSNKFISYTSIVRECVKFQTDVWTVSCKFTNTSDLCVSFKHWKSSVLFKVQLFVHIHRNKAKCLCHITSFVIFCNVKIFRQKNVMEKNVRFAPDPSLCSDGVLVLE